MRVTTAVRFALLLGARVVGRAVALLRHPLSLNVLLLAAIGGALAALDRLVAATEPDAERWLTPARVVAIWALVLLGWWVLRQRRRLLIPRFDDLTGDKTGAQGLSLLLASELVQLRDLFEEFEEGRVIQTTADIARGGAMPGRSPLFEATVHVDAPGALLETAISAESALAVGPIRIPVNVVLALVNRLVQGPRLTGQLQADGARRVVTVELAARGLRRTWRVEDGGAADGERRPLADMARELALRMLADLGFERPVRWPAVAALVAGLRAYRRTLRTDREGRLNLHEAERHLLAAIAEDNRFELACYNLGVVYLALDRLDAARSALARAVALNPSRHDGHYALAWVRYAQALAMRPEQGAAAARELRFALDHCNQAVALADGAQARATALNLQARVQMQLGGAEFFYAARICRRAVTQAWRALLGAELGLTWRGAAVARARQQATEVAAGSLQHLTFIARLALAHERQRGRGARRLVLRLLDRHSLTAAQAAARLQPARYEALLDLGAIWTERRAPRRATRVLRRATHLAPDRGEAWCWLAVASASLFRDDWVAIAYDKAINAGATLPAPLLDKLAEAARTLADATDALRQEIEGLPQRVAGLGRLRAFVTVMAAFTSLSYRMAGRRWYRWAPTAAVLKGALANREAWIAELGTLAGKRREAAERAAQFAEHRDTVARLAADATDRRAELEALYDKAIAAEHRWEAGDAAAALGRLALAHAAPEDARRWFAEAIAAFEPVHPDEIVRRGLHAQLARALLRLDDRKAAFDAARRAAAADPLSSFERDRLADCHFDLGEWGAARAQWEESLRTAPDQPGTYRSIALCWFNEAMGVDDRAQRRAALGRAAASLERALTLYESDSLERSDSQFLLGRIRQTLGDVAAAQALWHALESRAYRPLYLGLHLADSKLREVSFDDAERRFRALATQLDAELAGDAGRVDQPVDAMPGDPDRPTYGAAAAWAHLGVALALVRRLIGHDEALARVDRAREIARAFGEDADRRRWLGYCERIEGEIRFRHGDLSGAQGPLERSLHSAPASDGYYYLAAALLAELDPTAADAAARQRATRIRGLAALSATLDRDGEFDARLSELTARLAATAAGKGP